MSRREIYQKKQRRRKNRIRKKLIKRCILVAICIVSIILVVNLIYYSQNNNVHKENRQIHKNVKKSNNKNVVKQDNSTTNKTEAKEIVISAAGDFTLGTDTKFAYYGSFPALVKEYNYDYSHFMKNVYDIFKADDYTFVNLETTLTDSNDKANKTGNVVYNFKGSKDYVKILTSGSVEGVTLENNHSYDYGQQGLEDTINTLKQSGVDYCGYGYNIVKEIKGVKIGLLGYSAWYSSDELKSKIKNDIETLRAQNCKIVIPYFHWGEESRFTPNETQQEIGRYAIDCGADMVIGSHSHVIGTIENYKGKLIAYSLGNFCFGGNSNPSDKRTFILQAKFVLINQSINQIQYKVIPTLISSVDYRNDYIPTLATQDKANEIISELNKISPTLNGTINNDYFTLKK